MTAASISVAQSAVLTDLGGFVQSVLGLATGQVVRGLVNRTSMPPASPGFVSMTPVARRRLSTNVDGYTAVEPDVLQFEEAGGLLVFGQGIFYSPAAGANGTTNSRQGTRIEVQLDCYGKTSGDWAQILSTVLRDEYACDQLVVSQPLTADDPIQLPLIDGEQQYEERWVVRAFLQYNPVVSTPMQFADTIGAPAVNIYPPVNAQ